MVLKALLSETMDIIDEAPRTFAALGGIADEIVDENDGDKCMMLASALYSATDYRPRCVAAFLWAAQAGFNDTAERRLTESVGRDSEPRVQEVLSRAFNRLCGERGYSSSQPLMERWLSHSLPAVRKAAVQGPRIWTRRPFFCDNPHKALEILGPSRTDPSSTVRRLTAAAVREIAEDFPEVTRRIVSKWDFPNPKIAKLYSSILQ